MFETSEPQEASEILEALERLQQEGENFVAGMSPEDFFATRGEKWSASEHVRHLAKSVFPLAKALSLPKLVPWILFGRASRPSRSFAEIRDVYRGHLHAGAKAGKFTPAPRPLPQDPQQQRTEILALWRKSFGLLRSGILKWDDRAMDRYRLPHPILGKLTVREMLFFTLYHNSHHLRQVPRPE